MRYAWIDWLKISGISITIKGKLIKSFIFISFEQSSEQVSGKSSDDKSGLIPDIMMVAYKHITMAIACQILVPTGQDLNKRPTIVNLVSSGD